MKGLALVLLLAGRLALAPGAAADPPAAARPNPELGFTIGTVWFSPSAGVTTSLPVGSGLTVEGVVERMAGGNGRLLSQGQLRVPIPGGVLHRRSLLFGLTYLRERPGPEPSSLTSGLLAHAGIGFRQPLNRRLDLRLDLQFLIPLEREPGADPRAIIGFVWHRRTGSEAAR